MVKKTKPIKLIKLIKNYKKIFGVTKQSRQILLIISFAILLLTISGFVFSTKALALMPGKIYIKKTINISPGQTKILIFNEPVIGSKISNPKLINAEIITNIQNDREKLIIKYFENPQKTPTKNTLTIETPTKNYELHIVYSPSTTTAQVNKMPSFELKDGLQDFELDAPPKK